MPGACASTMRAAIPSQNLVALALRLRQSVAHQVMQTKQQLLQAGLDIFLPFGRAFGLRFHVNRFLGFLLHLFTFVLRTLRARSQPFAHPGGGFAGGESVGSGDIGKEEAQRVLAGKFPARAGAFERRLGKVDFRLVRIFAAALALPPEGQLACAQREPFFRQRQLAPGFYRALIRRQRRHLFFGPTYSRYFLQRSCALHFSV